VARVEPSDGVVLMRGERTWTESEAPAKGIRMSARPFRSPLRQEQTALIWAVNRFSGHKDVRLPCHRFSLPTSGG
jgi:hypothetical protein